jgi:integrase/recombinase XerD
MLLEMQNNANITCDLRQWCKEALAFMDEEDEEDKANEWHPIYCVCVCGYACLPVAVGVENFQMVNPIEVFLASKNQASRSSYKSSLAHCLRAKGTPTFEGIGLADVITIRSHFESATMAASSANRHMAALRGLLGTMFDLRLLEADEFERCKRALKPVRGDVVPRGRMLTSDDVAHVKAIATLREWAIISLALHTGLRREELADLTPTDVDWIVATVTVRKGKENKRRVVPIVTQSLGALREWMKQRPFRRSLFGLSKNRLGALISRVGKRAGIKLMPHDLRKTFVSRLLDAGVDLATVQRLVGHADPVTTAKYDRRKDAPLRKAAQLLSDALKGD